SRGQRILQVAEVDQPDDLLGRHVGEQPPYRLACYLGGQVPGGVDDGSDGHVHDALLRAQPPQLAVAYHGGPAATKGPDDVVDVLADDMPTERRDGGDHDLVAASDGEAQRVPFQPVS